jgi:predicted AAA+ superfamily ATPase
MQALLIPRLNQKFNNLYYFREKGECDFVVKEKNTVTRVVQACYELNADNLKRELNGLKEAMDYFDLKEGTIVTMNQTDTFDEGDKQIRVVSANEWLKLTNML